MWARFDRAVKAMGLALEGNRITTVAQTFAELSTVATELADACEGELEQQRRKTG